MDQKNGDEETKDNLLKLLEPFPENDIEWRVQACGEKNNKIWARVLAYVTNRAIQTRLDGVCGQGGWQNQFISGPSGGILCGISIKVDGEWVMKYDGAENTDIESIKGGLSSSMKRAAVQWGIGRYLYNLEADFAIVNERGAYSGKTKEGKWFKWDSPALPKWALIKGDEPKKTQQTEEPEPKIKVDSITLDEAKQRKQKQIDAMPVLVKKYFTSQNMMQEDQFSFCRERNGNVDTICNDIQALTVSEQFNSDGNSEVWENAK